MSSLCGYRGDVRVADEDRDDDRDGGEEGDPRHPERILVVSA